MPKNKHILWIQLIGLIFLLNMISCGLFHEPEGPGAEPPTVSTADIFAITDTSAQCGGNIISDGGAAIIARGVCWCTAEKYLPNLSDSLTIDGTGNGSFTSSISGLIPGTTYVARAYATNGMGTSYGNGRTFSTLGKVTDLDGNVYQTIKIGSQWWMTENLKVTKYRNGDSISYVFDSTEWFNLDSGAYCVHNNDSNNVSVFGILYNWYAIDDSRNIAPEGWHVPCNVEWNTLIDYLGGEDVAGGKMKDTGFTYWISPNTGATNSSGFTALPGGLRFPYGSYYILGGHAHFWSSTELSNDEAYFRYIFFNSPHIMLTYWDKRFGFSIRCVKD